MSKQQFLYALKKESQTVSMFGGFNPIDPNLDVDEKGLRQLTWWDNFYRKVRLGFYGTLYDMATSEKPRQFYDQIKERMQNNKSNLEEGIVLYHEKWVSGNSFQD